MKFLLALWLVVIFIVNPCSGEDGPYVGAIRWDAWTGGSITSQVEKTLSPKKYHHRLPWFAEINDDGTVNINGNSPDIMKQEIDYAKRAGLDYWAFSSLW